MATLRPDGNGSVDVFHVHADHLNTPRRLTRPSDNTIVWRWDSDPFGTTLAQEDPDGDGRSVEYNLRFPGQYYDAESGLHYNYFRDYDPSTGRYIQSDPIGLFGGLNVYSFALGNPIGLSDPTGLTPYYTSENSFWRDFEAQLTPSMDYFGCVARCVGTLALSEAAGQGAFSGALSAADFGARYSKIRWVVTSCKAALRVLPVADFVSTSYSAFQAGACFSRCE